jgi:hypothetical protein
LGDGITKNLHNRLSPVLNQDLRYLRIQEGVFDATSGVELSAAAIKLWRVCRDYEIDTM